MPARSDELILDLDGHCIQTAAQRLYRRLRDRLLAGDADPATRDHLELLRSFLQQVDFKAARASDPELCGTVAVRVRVVRRADGSLGWEKMGG
jgi:hypothetical protein